MVHDFVARRAVLSGRRDCPGYTHAHCLQAAAVLCRRGIRWRSAGPYPEYS